MKVLIIDNEAPIRAGLRMQLETYCPEIETIQEAVGVATGLKAIDNYQPDIVFLDVEMDDGTGLDLLKKLGNNYHFQLIFITAHNKYAVDALNKAMRIDLLPYNIKVTGINPGAVATEFSLVRYKGDAQKADATYNGITPLTGGDIADIIFYCASLPAHVCINDLVVTPTQQADGIYFNRN